MKYLVFALLFLIGCPKKTEDIPMYMTPIKEPFELEDEDLDDLPEADDTGEYFEEE
jgi:hypothetical protein